jgi:hypothetical protein
MVQAHLPMTGDGPFGVRRCGGQYSEDEVALATRRRSPGPTLTGRATKETSPLEGNLVCRPGRYILGFYPKLCTAGPVGAGEMARGLATKRSQLLLDKGLVCKEFRRNRRREPQTISDRSTKAHPAQGTERLRRSRRPDSNRRSPPRALATKRSQSLLDKGLECKEFRRNRCREPQTISDRSTEAHRRKDRLRRSRWRDSNRRSPPRPLTTKRSQKRSQLLLDKGLECNEFRGNRGREPQAIS